MRKIIDIVGFYLTRASRRTLLLTILFIFLIPVMLIVPFLGVPFTSITEQSLRQQLKQLGIEAENLPEKLALSIAFIYTQAPMLVVLFSSLGCLTFISGTLAEDRLTGAIEIILAAPFSDREIIMGSLISGIAYGFVVWLGSLSLFITTASALVLTYTGKTPILPDFYIVQTFLLSPLMIILGGIIAVYTVFLAPRVVRAQIPLTSNPLTMIALAPLLVYIIIISMPTGVDLHKVAIYFSTVVAISVIALISLAPRILCRRRLVSGM